MTAVNASQLSVTFMMIDCVNLLRKRHVVFGVAGAGTAGVQSIVGRFRNSRVGSSAGSFEATATTSFIFERPPVV